MGVSYKVKVLRREDENYKNKFAAAQALIKAGINLPQELEEFFGTGKPKFGDGLEVSCAYIDDDRENNDYMERIETNSSNTIRIHLDKLPEGVAYIDAEVSY